MTIFLENAEENYSLHFGSINEEKSLYSVFICHVLLVWKIRATGKEYFNMRVCKNLVISTKCHVTNARKEMCHNQESLLVLLYAIINP